MVVLAAADLDTKRRCRPAARCALRLRLSGTGKAQDFAAPLTAMPITAEIIAHANGASGLPLSLRTSSIHRAPAGILPTASTLIA